MAANFKIATRYYKILITLYIVKWNCYLVDKSAIFGMMIPWNLIFDFGLGATLKKSTMAAIFNIATGYYKILPTLYIAKMKVLLGK